MAQMTGSPHRADGQGRPQAFRRHDPQAFENAIRTNGAIGGSTNAVIHLLAMAGRVGIDLTLDDWDRCGRDVATIVNLMPSGKYLMEEFFYAGGLPVVLKRLGEGGPAAQGCADRGGTDLGRGQGCRQELERRRHPPGEKALTAQGGIAVLRATSRRRARSQTLGGVSASDDAHRGRAVVFEDIDDYKAKINDDALDIDESCIMVLKNVRTEGLSRHGRSRQHGIAARRS
jgi:L-arabonate dehydrase